MVDYYRMYMRGQLWINRDMPRPETGGMPVPATFLTTEEVYEVFKVYCREYNVKPGEMLNRLMLRYIEYCDNMMDNGELYAEYEKYEEEEQ